MNIEFLPQFHIRKFTGIQIYFRRSTRILFRLDFNKLQYGTKKIMKFSLFGPGRAETPCSKSLFHLTRLNGERWDTFKKSVMNSLELIY